VADGITLDTGALIALERGEKRMRSVVRGAIEHDVILTVPAVVLIEWWRGGKGDRQRHVIAGMTIEPTSERIAMAAGEALATMQASAVDAAVMASAALRGDVVYTSDFDDLQQLRAHFSSVRVLRTSG
jgi:predicted nucleic acid-binding protein